jgi:hypothetical protein
MQITSKLKSIILIVFMLSAASAFSQQPLSRYHASISIAPNYAYRFLEVVVKDIVQREFYHDFRANEQAKMGFSAAVELGYNLSNEFSIISGFALHERGFRHLDVIWMDEHAIYELGRADLTYQISSLAIPLKLEWNKKWQNYSFFMAAGVSFEYQVRNQYRADIRYHFPPESTEKLTFQRNEIPVPWYPPNEFDLSGKLAIAGLFDMGLRYHISSQTAVSFAPSFAYRFTSGFKYPVQENLFTVGFNIGMRYRFK